jgi:ankyrin repeat protein
METAVTDAEEKRYAELQLLALDAARAGDTATLISMVQAGLPANLQDLKGNTLLMLASYHGHAETTAALLQNGAEPDRRNLRHQTPLGGVAFKGYVEIAQLLLEAGADLNADQGGGTTPLMLASLFGRTEMIQLLQRRGADARGRCARPQPLGAFRQLVWPAVPPGPEAPAPVSAGGDLIGLFGLFF